MYVSYRYSFFKVPTPEHQVSLHYVHAAAMVCELTPVDLHSIHLMCKVTNHTPYTVFGVGTKVTLGVQLNLKTQLFPKIEGPHGRWRPIIAPPDELFSLTPRVSEIVPEWRQ